MIPEMHVSFPAYIPGAAELGAVNSGVFHDEGPYPYKFIYRAGKILFP